MRNHFSENTSWQLPASLSVFIIRNCFNSIRSDLTSSKGKIKDDTTDSSLGGSRLEPKQGTDFPNTFFVAFFTLTSECQDTTLRNWVVDTVTLNKENKERASHQPLCSVGK